MNETTDLEGKTFEELMAMLEEAVNQLDGNSLSLEESVAAYERSVAISTACEDILNKAEIRIEQIESRSPATAGPDDEDEIPF